MGLKYGDLIRNIPVPKTWWKEKEYGFTIDEKNLIRDFVRLGRYEVIASEHRCSLRTIQRQMELILTKIGTKDRQEALGIFYNQEAPDNFVKESGE